MEVAISLLLPARVAVTRADDSGRPVSARRIRPRMTAVCISAAGGAAGVAATAPGTPEGGVAGCCAAAPADNTIATTAKAIPRATLNALLLRASAADSTRPPTGGHQDPESNRRTRPRTSRARA